jgi:hypothetical protein
LNIAFTSTWQKTDFFSAVAKELCKDVGVFWIVTSDVYRRKLLAQGYGAHTLIHLRKDHALSGSSSEKDFELMRRLEERTGICVKSLILMDRFVSTWNTADALRYAAYVAASVHDFLKKNNIEIVLGEPSALHDLITDVVCQASGRLYTAPFDMRLPVNRFQFWLGTLERDLIVTGARSPLEVSPAALRMAEETIAAVTVERKRPGYWYKSNKVPRLSLRFAVKLAQGVYRAIVRSRTDGNSYSLAGVLFKLRYHMIPFNYLSTRLRWRRVFEEPVPGERFVLYALAKQPEQVDVEGAHFANQTEFIRSVARELPLDVRLYVKEHRNSLGDRSPSEFAKFKEIPGVRLIDPFVDVHDLIRDAELVVTISGTTTLEAALYGKHALLASDLFTANFSTCERIFHPSEIGTKLRGPRPAHQPEHDVRYLAYLLENSFEGTICDPVSAPECLQPDNVRNVARAIERLVEHHAAQLDRRMQICLDLLERRSSSAESLPLTARAKSVSAGG